ncbi:MAG TPA: Crp/Fnr family transcriptional regulator [Patescibacteria group bacterium]|nr:Crp/Fnr family transcriptional regulator [Patescibacteria group bacterium]
MDPDVVEKLEKFFTKYKPQKYKKGEILVRAGDNPLGVFYLTEGYIKKYAISQKGDELVVNIFKPISFFPMSHAINNSPNDYYYEAAVPVTVYRAPNSEVVKFVKENPDVLYDLISRVYRGTDGMLAKMTYLMAGSAYDRLITELVIHAKRFGIREGNTIELKVSEKDLAAQSGLTRETVSREIKILKDKGLLILGKSIQIPDISKLEGELLEDI